MKKIIGILAVINFTTMIAGASTARIEALQSASHLTDAVTIFGNPSNVHKLPDVALIEYGASNTFGGSAKGGFLRAMDDSKLGLFLGVGSDVRVEATAGTLDFEGIENPFTIVYGGKAADMGWGVALSYSSSAKKSDIGAVTGTSYANLDSATQSKIDLTGSVDMGSWNVGATFGLGDTAKTTLTTGSEASYAATSTKLFGYYSLDTMVFGLGYDLSSTKIDKTLAAVKSSVKDESGNTITLSALNDLKKEGADFFYGVSYVLESVKDNEAASTTTTSTLPVIVGVEADAASWLVLRASITQNVFIGSKSIKSTTTVTDTIDHDTKVAAGMGLKLNKSILDMTLSAATSNTGAIASSDLGALAAYTYMF